MKLPVSSWSYVYNHRLVMLTVFIRKLLSTVDRSSFRVASLVKAQRINDCGVQGLRWDICITHSNGQRKFQRKGKIINSWRMGRSAVKQSLGWVMAVALTKSLHLQLQDLNKTRPITVSSWTQNMPTRLNYFLKDYWQLIISGRWWSFSSMV